ncbi:23S rRNA (adenine(1618)-N(6))-methyltransferase [Vibrio sp. 10N.286.49.B3]|uniref:23S rRNA (adenine(1618)-N(6))-methyltransferase RlmF n=1 Tax=Vibrio sp. 10N.286.49.B3 TaxID=1880855 RepID=UPI000C83D8C6|nr:23S rRNA (adenine(1618)-N(6))-methyltransferase RlmF [Vibrio sp. 10N.286.49.B3]PMH46129.1 23S rRNA (adenine(1618)-N(6))-methyltransferase [Vibrio sp. 10N.286.49.B3]
MSQVDKKSKLGLKPGTSAPKKNINHKKKSDSKVQGGGKPHFAHKGPFKKKIKTAPKLGLHPRNQHHGRYDFPALIKALPELASHVIVNPYGDESVNFSNPESVKLLNKALLMHHYNLIHWDIPQGYLCPPIPGRADYIHRAADILNAECKDGEFPHRYVRALDIGMGANCIYPIIGAKEYSWKFVGSDIDPISVKNASFIVSANPKLKGRVSCRLQKDSNSFFSGIIKKNENYDITFCNPPFHKSAEEANEGSQRKIDNLNENKKKRGTFVPSARKGKEPAVLNFGGQHNELWCPGGEAEFIRNMIEDSTKFAGQVLWFTTLVSKQEHVTELEPLLYQQGAQAIKIVHMQQGQKSSRFIAWTFLDKEQRQEWLESMH